MHSLNEQESSILQQSTVQLADSPMADSPMADSPMADSPMADSPTAIQSEFKTNTRLSHEIFEEKNTNTFDAMISPYDSDDNSAVNSDSDDNTSLNNTSMRITPNTVDNSETINLLSDSIQSSPNTINSAFTPRPLTRLTESQSQDNQYPSAQFRIQGLRRRRPAPINPPEPELNPLFSLIGAQSQGSSNPFTISSRYRSYAEVAASQPNRSENIPLGNNVVTRTRVRDAMYRILEEIEELKSSLPERIYLNVSNDLRIIYDYITQNDINLEDTPFNRIISQLPFRSGTPRPTIPSNTQPTSTSSGNEFKENHITETPAVSMDENKSDNRDLPHTAVEVRSIVLNNYFGTLFASLFQQINNLQRTQQASSEFVNTEDLPTEYESTNRGIRNYYLTQLYNGFYWTVTKAPFYRLWQFIIFLIWFIIATIFCMINIFITSIHHISNRLVKKVVLFGILFLEEILAYERIRTNNMQYNIFCMVLIECLKITRIRILE